MTDNKDDEKLSAGWKATFVGASAANGAFFGSILGPIGALGGALVMGGITLAITSLKVPPLSKPKRIPSQEKETLSGNDGLLAFRYRVSGVLDEIERPRKDERWTWEDIRNEEASVLPIEVCLTGSAAEVFLKWKIGYDEYQSAGPGLGILTAVGQALIGHWGGAATSVAKAIIKANGLEHSYKAFLDSDQYFAACATIMVVYDAEIETAGLIVLKRATASEISNLHGDKFTKFGGTITDRRANRRSL